MATDVVMPQMGESVAEGTVVRWIKKVGDKVDRDEPLFEISTDKVDAEIPSPAAGVVTEIRVKEGETVPVNSVVAVIGEAGEATASPAPAPPAASASPGSASLVRLAANGHAHRPSGPTEPAAGRRNAQPPVGRPVARRLQATTFLQTTGQRARHVPSGTGDQPDGVFN